MKNNIKVNRIVFVLFFTVALFLTLGFSMLKMEQAKASASIDVVYVSSTGSDINGNGSEDSPYSTLNKAISAVSDRGVVQIVDTLTLASNFSWENHSGKTVTITGGTLDATALSTFDIKDNVTFDSLTINFTEGIAVCANGYNVVINDDVTFSNYVTLKGGANGVKQVNLTVNGGSYKEIYGAGASVLGDVHLNIGGNASFDSSSGKIWGAGGTVDGNVYLTVSGGNPQQIWGGGWRSTVKGSTFVTIESSFNSSVGYLCGGGCDNRVESTAKVNGDVNLEVNGGTFSKILGAGDYCVVSGNVNVTVKGETNASVDATSHSGLANVYGGGTNCNVSGDVNLLFTGNAKANYVFGGATGASSVIGGNIYQHFAGGTAMSIYGGNNDVDTGKSINLLMTGGTVEQVFGANQSSGYTGNVTVRLLGGTISRRVYGGCYNEVVNKYIFSWEWKSSYYVKGDISLVIGDGVNITFSYNDNDKSIYAHSRQKTLSSTENSKLIFDGDSANTKYKDSVKAQDSIMKSIMSGVSAADSTHVITYSKNGNVVTESCSSCSTTHTATVSFTAPDACVYNGIAYIPTTSITYSSGWESGHLFLSYNNNVNAGTANAKAYADLSNYVSFDFTIANGSQEAPDVSKFIATHETIKAKSDGKISGVDDTMEYSLDGKSYVSLTGSEITDLTGGTYYIRYKAKTNYNASSAVTVTVNSGKMLKVTFKSEGSNDIVKEVEWDSTLTDIPAVPTKVGYTQTAPYWDRTIFTNIKEDITVNAIYTINKYTITFKADGNTVATKQVEHGGDVGDIPTIPEKEGYTQTAPCWNVTDFTNITANKTVNAVYTINKYTVTFKANGSSDIVRIVEWNSTLTDIPAVPTKVGYTQTAPYWDRTSFANIKENIVVNAVYTINKYTITFKADGNTVATKQVEHGGALTDIPEVPPKDGVDSPIWDMSNFTNITSNLTVNAIYIENVYTIKFMVGDSILIERIVVHGGELSDIPEIPEKAGYDQIAPYWDVEEFINVTSNITVNAIYTVNVYTVTFKVDGEVLTTKSVNHGEALTDIPNVPFKTGYTGAWSVEEFTEITSDLIVTSIYTLNVYTISFIVDGNVFDTKTVVHGDSLIDIPTVPVKEGYTGEWDVTDYTNVISDKTVTAVYTEIPTQSGDNNSNTDNPNGSGQNDSSDTNNGNLDDNKNGEEQPPVKEAEGCSSSVITESLPLMITVFTALGFIVIYKKKRAHN